MGVEEGDVLYLSMPDNLGDKVPALIPELDGTRQQKYDVNDADVPEEEPWLNRDGTPMSPQQIERMKSFGITSPADMREKMKQFRRGGGQGGGRPSGGSKPASTSTTSGQPSK